MGTAYSIHGRTQDCKVLVEKSEGKGPLWRLRCTEYDNIRMQLKETGWMSTGLIRIRIGTW